MVYLFKITFCMSLLAFTSVFSTYHSLTYVLYLFISLIIYLPYHNVSSMRVGLSGFVFHYRNLAAYINASQ